MYCGSWGNEPHIGSGVEEMLGNISDPSGERRLKAWWFPGASFYLHKREFV